MDVIERLGQLDTCAVSDALDACGLPGATTGLQPLWPGSGTVAGRVRTLQAAPKVDGVPAQHIGTLVIASAGPADVVVIANGGRLDVSCWGGILAQAALLAGIRGIVVDGACRDIGDSRRLGLPVFGRAVVPVSARNRIVQAAMDIPVQIGGVAVGPQDYVLADENGVVFIPSEQAEVVTGLAELIARREQTMVDAVLGGQSVVDVMHDNRFPTREDLA